MDESNKLVHHDLVTDKRARRNR
ncbi:hypothetical protein D018_3945A, partial [Vibrio parahaemolyticus VP2007-007]